MAMMPRPTAPIAGPGGLPTREWLDYLRDLAGAGDLSGITRAIAELERQVAKLQQSGAAGEVLGIGAIQNIGSLADGLVRLDLRALPDAGGGELVNILRDGYGRVAGTSSAEAPQDGKQYARKDAAWSEIEGGAGSPGPPGPPGVPGPSSSCFPTASFDGGTGDIQVGAWCEVFVPFGFTVRSWTLVSDALGTISIDVQAASFSAYPPAAASSICGGNPPKLLGDNKATDSALTGWTPGVPSGSVIRFVVTASGGINRATLTLTGERT